MNPEPSEHVEPDLSEYDALVQRWNASEEALNCSEALSLVLKYRTWDAYDEDDEDAPAGTLIPDSWWDMAEEMGVRGIVEGLTLSGTAMARVILETALPQ